MMIDFFFFFFFVRSIGGVLKNNFEFPPVDFKDNTFVYLLTMKDTNAKVNNLKE